MNTMLTGNEAREGILRGIRKVADAVLPTLGGGSKGVIIEQKGYPLVVNDGVTVVNAIDSDDRFERLGIRLMQQVANQTQKASGDGTTTATVLAAELCDLFVESNLDWMEWCNALDRLSDDAEYRLRDDEFLNTFGKWSLFDVAMTATRDEELSKLVSEVIDETGKDGNVTFRPSLGGKTYWETVDGFRMDTGLINTLFANKDNGKYEKDNPVIVFASYTIQNFEDITPALEIAVGEGRPILFVVAGMKGVALSNLLVNKAAGVIDACVVKCGGQGQDMLNWMADIQAITGGKTFTMPEELQGIAKGQNHFGSCAKVEATEDYIVFSSEAWDVDGEVDDYVAYLRNALEETHGEWEQDKLQNRISRLSQGIVTIFVGGHSDIEITDKREKIDDAINACRHALDGVIKGGALGLYQLASFFNGDIRCSKSDVAIATALRRIRRHIAVNMGQSPDVGRDYPVQGNILDPITVVVNSIRSAVSVAQQFARIEVAVLVEDSD